VSGRPLSGKVVAVIGPGGDLHRALAIACAEAGADLALATSDRSQQQEFAVNSIANEAWAVGVDHFVTRLDALDPAEVMAFADQAWDRYRRCDALVCAHDVPSNAPLDELSADEWAATLAANLTAPFLALHAFGRSMERDGRGTVVAVVPHHAAADAAYRAARAGLAAAVADIEETWAARGVRAVVLEVDPAAPRDAGSALAALLTGP
jgi:NAD(P)-dependent dehydrogenase (short-subunit alcohol dehydrogenase family)